MPAVGRSRGEWGQLGESLAAQMLEARGYVIVERNWRCPVGEADLIAQDGEVWVFVEVKLRRSLLYGTPEDAITPSKRRRLLGVGLAYMDAHELLDAPWRIDVVAITLSPGGKVERLALYQDAIRANE